MTDPSRGQVLVGDAPKWEGRVAQDLYESGKKLASVYPAANRTTKVWWASVGELMRGPFRTREEAKSAAMLVLQDVKRLERLQAFREMGSNAA